MSLPLLGAGTGAGSGSGTSSEVSAFLARTSGHDGTHVSAYTALINGLVSDSVWSKLDFLHIYATQDTTTAQLNLVSSSYPATLNGSPTFTADRGYTGTNASSTVYINTSFNPTTASSPKFVLNSAHISMWQVNNVQSQSIGVVDGASASTAINPRFTDNKGYFYINNSDSNRAVLASSTDSTGHWISSRTSSSVLTAYRNGSSVASSGLASGAIANRNIYTLAVDAGGTANGTSGQCAMASLGSSLNGTDATNLYNRLRTYMTAVGVP